MTVKYLCNANTNTREGNQRAEQLICSYDDGQQIEPVEFEIKDCVHASV